MNASGRDPTFIRTKTTCPYCGVGCGVVVEGPPGHIKVSGDPDHPANFGRLCSKGAALGETTGLSGRLLYPQMGGERTSWDAATSAIAQKFQQVIEDHGPDAVAFYVSGQILIEDYYVANKLMKGFIGSANIDTNSRLCMASSVAGHKRAFGSDTVPGCYEDLELADLVVLVGSNLAWCHPVLYQRLATAKRQRPDMRVVVIDPRATATCEIADLHLKLAPGSDVALFQGLFKALEQDGIVDEKFVSRHTNNLAAVSEAARPFDIFRVSEAANLSIEEISVFYNWFASTEKAVTVYSQGVNQAADGTDRVNTIINSHLLTGRIGKPGMGPFSVTGQPDAMGGREVGGLANQLASHLELHHESDRQLVQRFWNAPRIADKPGLKAVDLFEAVHDGRVKAIWIMATNPVVSMPNADRVRAALERCELVVVSDVMADTDTAECADILLPSTAWGEKTGMVTNSERRMSRQRSFLAAPGDAKDDWRQFCDVAEKMGWRGSFDYRSVHEVFREYARLCAFENKGQRDLDLSALTDIDDRQYESFPPTMWPAVDDAGTDTKRFFSDGHFFTKNGRANFVVPSSGVRHETDAAFPLVLNTGRIRDQWHTMTRTGMAPTLTRHICEPFVEISPPDAAQNGLKPADIAQISSPYGSMKARVLVTDRQQSGSIFVPMHWTGCNSGAGRVDALVAPVTDPVSGQPAAKSSPAAISSLPAEWFAFGAISSEGELSCDGFGCEYWALAQTGFGYRVEMAGLDRLKQVSSLADRLFGTIECQDGSASEAVRYGDVGKGQFREALFVDGVLRGLIFVGTEPVVASRSWLCAQIGKRFDIRARQFLLAGRPGDDQPDPGPIVCSCMNVGANTIHKAVASGCRSIEEIGAATQAGTNCGSCTAELRRFLREPAHA